MKTKFLFLLLLGILLSVKVEADSQSTRKRIALKAATSTSQGTPRSINPISWINACYDVEESKLLIGIPVPDGNLTVTVSDPLTGEMVYSESYSASNIVVIDMSGTEAGSYLLNIFIGENLLSGEFNIE